MIRFLICLVALVALPELASAQQLPTDLLNQPMSGSAASWIIRTFGLLTVLSVAPGILMMVTSFPRFIIAFSILRSGMGLATAPANMVLLSLALFMTFYVMAPTFQKAWDDGVQPLMSDKITETQAVPLHRRAVPHLHGGERPQEGRPAFHGYRRRSAGRRSSPTTTRSTIASSSPPS